MKKKIKILEKDWKGELVETEYILQINEQGINFDSIIPGIPNEVLWRGEWIYREDLSDLYKGAWKTPYVQGVRFEAYTKDGKRRDIEFII